MFLTCECLFHSSLCIQISFVLFYVGTVYCDFSVIAYSVNMTGFVYPLSYRSTFRWFSILVLWKLLQWIYFCILLGVISWNLRICTWMWNCWIRICKCSDLWDMSKLLSQLIFSPHSQWLAIILLNLCQSKWKLLKWSCDFNLYSSASHFDLVSFPIFFFKFAFCVFWKMSIQVCCSFFCWVVCLFLVEQW